MGRTKNTKIWNYFDQVSLYLACCKLCDAQITCKSSISNLVRHLYALHRLDLSSQGAAQSAFLNYGRKTRSRLKPNQRRNVPSDVDADEPEFLSEDEQVGESMKPLEFFIKKEAELEATTSMEQQTMNACTEEQRSQLEDKQFSTRHSQSEFEIRYHVPPPNRSETITNHMRKSDATAAGGTNRQRFNGESPALRAKLKAETRYYNELAALSRARRIMVELQNNKLRAEIDKIIAS